MADRVNVLTPSGEKASLDSKDLADAVAHGYKPVTPELEKKFEIEEKYGGTVDTVAAGLAGLARGPTFGLSDKLLVEGARALGDDKGADFTRDTLKGWREGNPLTSGTTEAIGDIGALIGSGGGSLLAKGATKAIGGKLASSALGRIGTRAVALGVAGAAENAAMGARHNITEATLGDEKITAQKILAGTGTDALWGAGLGAGFGALGGAVSEGFGALRGKFQPKAIDGAVPTAATEAGTKAPRTIGDRLEDLYANSVFKQVGGNKAIAKQTAQYYEGGTAAFAKDVDRDIQGLGYKLSDVDAVTGKEIAEKLKAKSWATESKIHAALDENPATVAARPKIGDIIKDAEAKMGELRAQGLPTAPLEAHIERMKDAVGVVEHGHGPSLPGEGLPAAPWRDEPVTFSQLFNLKRGAAELGNYKNLADPRPVVDAFRDLEQSLRARLENATDLLVDSQGKGMRAEYMAAKQGYQRALFLEDAAKNAGAAGSANQFFGLAAKIAGSVGAGAGAVLGGPLGSLVGSATGAFAGKALDKYGNALIADALRPHVTGEAVRAVAMQTAKTDNAIAQGVKSFLHGTGETVKKGLLVETTRAAEGGRTPKSEYDRRFGTVAQMVGNPSFAARRMTESMGDLPRVAPNVAAALTAKGGQVADYLFGIAPKKKHSPFDLQPHMGSIPDDEMAKWLRTAMVATNPLRALERMQRGGLSRDEAGALRTLYPDIYSQIQSHVMQEIADMTRKGRTLPYNKRVQLGTLFGVPTDRTMDPKFIQAIQATFGHADSQPEQPAMPSGKAIEVAESFTSAGDKLES